MLAVIGSLDLARGGVTNSSKPILFFNSCPRVTLFLHRRFCEFEFTITVFAILTMVLDSKMWFLTRRFNFLQMCRLFYSLDSSIVHDVPAGVIETRREKKWKCYSRARFCHCLPCRSLFPLKVAFLTMRGRHRCR